MVSVGQEDQEVADAVASAASAASVGQEDLEAVAAVAPAVSADLVVLQAVVELAQVV